MQSGLDIIEPKALEQPQDLDVFPLAGLSHARFQQALIAAPLCTSHKTSLAFQPLSALISSRLSGVNARHSTLF